MTELTALQPANVEIGSGNAPGPRPRLAWLPISSLCVDHSYQRPVNARGLRTIAQICVAFEWCRFSPVIVAKAEDERYAIIDGQHRTIAALTLGYDEVPCSVIAADSKMQASIFASINGTVTPISKLALYKAGVRSGAEWALQVKRVCESAGIIALTYPKPYKALKPFETQSISTLINRIGRHGEHVVTNALKLEAKQPGADTPGHFSPDTIDAAIHRVRSVTFTEKAHPAEDKAARIRELKSRGYSRQAIAAALGVTYATVEEALA